MKRVFIVCKATVWRSCICSRRAGLGWPGCGKRERKVDAMVRDGG